MVSLGSQGRVGSLINLLVPGSVLPYSSLSGLRLNLPLWGLEGTCVSGFHCDFPTVELRIGRLRNQPVPLLPLTDEEVHMFRLDTSWHSLTVGSFHKELKINGSFLKIRENIKLARIQINTSSLSCLSASALTVGTDAAISVSETTQHMKPSSVWPHGGPLREKSFKFIFILLIIIHTR